MKTGKRIFAVMLLAVFMLAANAVLVPATAGAEDLSVTIKEGLKAGKSLQQVVDEALKNGNPIDKIVTEAIKAGARADDAVYVAVKVKPESNSAEAIVKAALLTGAKIETVAGAAKAAGARNGDIRSGYYRALMANGLRYWEASEKAKALDLNRNTFAYSPPAGNTSKSNDNTSTNTSTTNTSTTNTTSTFSYTVNNTGGATPSTKTASPM